jgi:hypothetical protein
MPDQEFELDVLRDLLEEARSIGQLAEDEGAFREAYEAFRASDVRKFQGVLKRLGLRCRLICQWIRIKECIFVCLKLCGPPKPTDRQPNPRELAEAIVRISSDERLVQQLAEAVEKRDHDSFQRIVEQFKLGNLCHYFCHWLCVVRYRLICHWLCSIEKVERPNFARELQSAGQALRQLLEHKDSFDQAVAASDAGDAEKLRAVIHAAGLVSFCHFICEWFCSWRCTRVCLILCRAFPLEPIRDEISEALAFAKAMQKLGQQPLELEHLSAAVAAGDAKIYSELVRKLKLQRFCIQLCHWICFLRCRRFCLIVCPGLRPEFTSIGGIDYLTQIHSAVPGSGLTIAGNYAFTDLAEGFMDKPVASLRLNGVLPEKLSGAPMEYRFEFAPTKSDGTFVGPWTPVVPAQIAPTLIGHWQPLFGLTKKYWVNNPAPGPGEFNVTPAPDGWIKVPQDAGIFGNFSSNGNQINLISSALTAFPPKDEAGVVTGNAPNHPLVENKHFALRMRARKVGDAGDGIDAGTCNHVAIDNTFYDNVKPHPAWDGGAAFPPNQRAVRMVNIQELGPTGCQKITDSLTVKFTAAHPNLGSASLTMTGGGGVHSFNPPSGAAPGPEWFGTAVPEAFTVNDLPPCAYLLTLEIIVLLTDGDITIDPLYDQIAFCKAPS